jgi:hypothetical protein
MCRARPVYPRRSVCRAPWVETIIRRGSLRAGSFDAEGRTWWFARIAASSIRSCATEFVFNHSRWPITGRYIDRLERVKKRIASASISPAMTARRMPASVAAKQRNHSRFEVSKVQGRIHNHGRTRWRQPGRKFTNGTETRACRCRSRHRGARLPVSHP